LANGRARRTRRRTRRTRGRRRHRRAGPTRSSGVGTSPYTFPSTTAPECPADHAAPPRGGRVSVRRLAPNRYAAHARRAGRRDHEHDDDGSRATAELDDDCADDHATERASARGPVAVRLLRGRCDERDQATRRRARRHRHRPRWHRGEPVGHVRAHAQERDVHDECDGLPRRRCGLVHRNVRRACRHPWARALGAGHHVTAPRRHAVAEGVMVVAALLAAAVALLGALRAPVTPQAALVVHVLVLVGTCAWFVVVYGVTRIVVAVLKGDTADLAHGPLGWAAIRVAALVLVVAPFLQAPGPSRAAPLGPTARTQPARATHAVHAGSPGAAAMHAVPEQHLLEVPHRVARHRPNGGHRGKDGTVAPPSLGTGAFLVALPARLRRLVRTDSRGG